MSQTKKHCEPLVAVWLRPSTTEPCICCKQVAEKPRGEHLKNDVCMYIMTLQLHIRLAFADDLLTRKATRYEGNKVVAFGRWVLKTEQTK